MHKKLLSLLRSLHNLLQAGMPSCLLHACLVDLARNRGNDFALRPSMMDTSAYCEDQNGASLCIEPDSYPFMHTNSRIGDVMLADKDSLAPNVSLHSV